MKNAAIAKKDLIKSLIAPLPLPSVKKMVTRTGRV
jgi:hypothetical protein